MLAGKVAFITGSTRGIGWATARLFAQQGSSVIVCGRSLSDAEVRAAELRREFSVAALGLGCDVGNPDDVRKAFQAIFKTFKRLDILVNNAGILEDALLGMISDEALERVMSVNALGSIHCLQAAARLMSRSGGGSIVNLTSIIGTNGNEGQVAYAASKAAVIGATLSAAKELAPAKVRVNAIAPGFIDTDMVRQIPKEKFDQRMASIKMARIGRPEDIANAALFFASDMSAYVTGQVLGVDGGMLI